MRDTKRQTLNETRLATASLPAGRQARPALQGLDSVVIVDYNCSHGGQQWK